MIQRISVLLGFFLLLVWTPIAHAQVFVAEGSKNIFTGTVAANAQNEPMLQVCVDNPQANNNIEVTEISLTASGTGHDVNDIVPGSVKAFWDKNNDGRLTTGTANSDLELGSGSFGADNGRVTISGFNFTVLKGTEGNILVTFSLNNGALAGETFRVSMAANTDIKIKDAVTSNALTVTGAPVQGFSRTVGKGTLTFVRMVQTPDGGVAIPNRSLLPLINIQALADDVEDLNVTSITFKDIGTANPLIGLRPGSMKLYAFPKTRTTAPVLSDIPAATGSFAIDNGTVAFAPSSPVVVPRDSNIRIWVTADVVDAESSEIGKIFKAQVPATNSVVVSGKYSQQVPAIIGAGINGPDWEFNYNPLFLTKSSDLGERLVAPAAKRYPMLSFQLKNDPTAKSEIVSVSRFRFHLDGTMNDSAITSVSLYRDNSPLGKYNDTDLYIGSASLPISDNGIADVNFSGQPLSLNTGAYINFLVTADFNGTPTDGKTVRMSLLDRDDISAIGAISMVNGALIPSPFNGAYKTVGQPRAAFYLQTNVRYIPPIIAPGAPAFPLLGFQIYNANDEDLLFQGVNLELKGSGDETKYFDQFEVWFDYDGDGAQDILDDDYRLGASVAPVVENGTTYLRIAVPAESAFLVARNTGRRFTVYAKVKPTVKGDGTEIFSIVADAHADIIAIGNGSEAQAKFTTAIPPFSLDRTIKNPAIEITNYPTSSNVTGCINGAYGFIGSKFIVPEAEDLVIKKIRFKASGTLADQLYVAGAYVWHDKNKNLLIDNGDGGYYLYSDKLPFTVDNGEGVIDMTEFPYVAERGKESALSIGFDFQALNPPTAKAQLGKTFTGWQIGVALEGTGALSSRSVTVTNPPAGDQCRTMTFDHGNLSVKFGKVARAAGPPNGSKIEVFSLYLKTHLLESVNIGRLALKPMGTINESIHIKPNGLKVYIDDNKNGKIDEEDDFCGYGNPPAADNGSMVINWLDLPYSNLVYSHPRIGNPYDQLLFTVDLTDTAPAGSTMQFKLATTSDLKASGSLSLIDYFTDGFMNYLDIPPIIGPEVYVSPGTVDIRPNTSFLNDRDNQPCVSMAPKATNYEVLRLDAKSSTSENVSLLGLTIRASGTANIVSDLKPLGVGLYKGSVQASNLLTSASFNASDKRVTLTNFKQPVVLTSTATTDLRLAFSGSGSGAIGKTINLSFGPSDLIAEGVSSQLPIRTITPVTTVTAPTIKFNTGRIYVHGLEKDTFLLPVPTGTYSRIQKLQLSASRVEDLRLEDMEVRAVGTANETLALQGGALLFQKWGSVNPVLAGSAPFMPGDNGKAALRNLNIDIKAEANTSAYSLDGDLNPANMVVNSTLQMDLESTATSVRAVGALTGQSVEVVFDDYAGEDTTNNVSRLTGRKITFSSGIVVLRQGSNPPQNATLTNSHSRVPLMHIKVEVADALEGVTISEVSVGSDGSADETKAIKGVYLYNDVNNDGLVNSSDLLLGSATYAANNGLARIKNLNLTYPEDTITNWVVAADIDSTALTTTTIHAVFDPATIVKGVGQLTKQPINLMVGSQPPVGATYSITPPRPTAATIWSVYE